MMNLGLIDELGLMVNPHIGLTSALACSRGMIVRRPKRRCRKFLTNAAWWLTSESRRRPNAALRVSLAV
jgi:hypothetical protein